MSGWYNQSKSTSRAEGFAFDLSWSNKRELNMKCDKIQKMLPDYVTGNLEENIIDEINKHLQQCQKCHHEYTMLDEMWSKMALSPSSRKF